MLHLIADLGGTAFFAVVIGEFDDLFCVFLVHAASSDQLGDLGLGGGEGITGLGHAHIVAPRQSGFFRRMGVGKLIYQRFQTGNPRIEVLDAVFGGRGEKLLILLRLRVGLIEAEQAFSLTNCDREIRFLIGTGHGGGSNDRHCKDDRRTQSCDKPSAHDKKLLTKK